MNRQRLSIAEQLVTVMAAGGPKEASDAKARTPARGYKTLNVHFFEQRP